MMFEGTLDAVILTGANLVGIIFIGWAWYNLKVMELRARKREFE